MLSIVDATSTTSGITITLPRSTTSIAIVLIPMYVSFVIRFIDSNTNSPFSMDTTPMLVSLILMVLAADSVSHFNSFFNHFFILYIINDIIFIKIILIK